MKDFHFIKNLPKAELHLHIEGTLEPELMMELAKRNQVALPYATVEEIREAYKFNNLQDFLDIYYQGSSVLLTHQDFYDLTYAYLQKANEDCIHHVEIFFDPQSHTQRGISFKTVVEGISEALEHGKRDFNISSFLIMCFLRHLSEEDAIQTLNESLPFKDKIKAVGLDSSELGHPPLKFKKVFQLAKSVGYKSVAHAGEEGSAEYIWEALNHLEVTRIDHGVRCSEDELLINKLVKENIPLTVCPLSNIKLRVFNTMADHNIKILFDRGLCVTINSDDPSYFGGYLVENYMQCHKNLDLSLKDMAQIANNSFQASFLSQEEKQKFNSLINSYIQEFSDVHLKTKKMQYKEEGIFVS